MFRIVRTRTLRALHNRAEAERIKRIASDNTAVVALNLLDEWLLFGGPVGGYNGTLEQRTDAFVNRGKHSRTVGVRT